MRLLIIEDNPAIVENLTDFLGFKGYDLDYAMDGIGGLHLALTNDYDVIVLDLMLPGMDGITLCQKLRREADKQVPVIMLTARDTLEDKLLGFDSGADDYLVKPFALKELEARIKALCKRRVSENKVLEVSELKMDLGTFEVTRAGREIQLNNTCTSILKMLMEASPNVVTRKELTNHLWGDMPPGTDVLRSHMYTLRQKIDKPFEYAMIETVHGVGFRLRENRP
ncbi:response regulator transcription factor [Dethiosulfatarculus sandiegensis]|uniref:XRE family transcriptional regulator n=1 Tax=Dethiosulfatarculus sandiegensis TaxID=1429043 RepID=A0A0D2GGS8_9BACT|nr:XRE family transcriptional regulator [Dethiosulfatarculus sandiegensis]